MHISQKKIIGVDLGGTKICVAVSDYEGKILAELKFPTPIPSVPEAVLASIHSGIEDVRKKAGVAWESIEDIGISCPGPVDPEKGILYNPPNMDGWGEVHLKKIFQEKYKKTVWVENDANAAALAERYFGAGREYASQVYLTLSTGIGGGIIMDGKLVRGAHFSAGEVGHIQLVPEGPLCGCGKKGCFEALCSGTALARRMREMDAKEPHLLWRKKAGGDPAGLKPPVLLKAAREKDPRSLELLEEAGDYLGLGCAQIANILDPEVFILGTLAIHFGELLLAPARRSFLRHLFFHPQTPAPFLAARLGENLAGMAAISVALQYHR